MVEKELLLCASLIDEKMFYDSSTVMGKHLTYHQAERPSENKTIDKNNHQVIEECKLEGLM